MTNKPGFNHLRGTLWPPLECHGASPMQPGMVIEQTYLLAGVGVRSGDAKKGEAGEGFPGLAWVQAVTP